MVNVKAAIILLFAALLLAQPAFASELTVKVTVTQDTPSVAANVTLVCGGVELASKKTGGDGIAKFNVTDGSYFVVLPPTSIYPKYVSLIRVNNSTQVLLTKYLCTAGCTANAYGQIYGPSDFSNASVGAFSRGVIVKRVYANPDGFFTISYIPEGDYELLFEAPGYEELRMQVYLPSSNFVEANARLSKIEEPPVQEVTLTSPLQSGQKSTIEAALARGKMPLAGEKVEVETPSGRITLTTDSSGIVRVNAVEAGEYRFAYGGITSLTTVQSEEEPAPDEQPSLPSLQEPDAPSAPQEPIKNDLIAIAAAAAIGVFAFIGAIVLALVALRILHGGKGASRAQREKRQKEKGDETGDDPHAKYRPKE